MRFVLMLVFQFAKLRNVTSLLKLVHVTRFLQSLCIVMHQSFETPAPPHSGLSGGLRGLSPHIHFVLVPRWPGNSLEVTVFASPTRLFAGRSKIKLFISWLPTVFFNQCVTLGNKPKCALRSATKRLLIVLKSSTIT